MTISWRGKRYALRENKGKSLTGKENLDSQSHESELSWNNEW